MRKGWEYKKLGEVSVYPNKRIQISELNPQDYVGVENLQKNKAGIVFSDKLPNTDSAIVFSPNDILIGNIRPYLKKIWLADKSGGASGDVIIIRLCTNDLMPMYLYRVLASDKFFEYANTFTKGAKMPRGDRNAIAKFIVPLPPKSTQLAIVSELDKINELIRLKKEQLKDFDNLAQSLFYEMFGDPVENEKGWEVSSVENVCSSIVRGPFGSALKKEFFVEPNSNTYKVYEQKHAIQKEAKIGSYYVTEEKFKELSRFEVKSGDIIMSCSGTIGELFIIPPNAEKGLMNQALLKFTLNYQIYKRFFLFLMDCVKKNFIVRGTGLQNIGSVKIIKAMTFGLPPLSLQRLFAQRIEQIEREKSEVQKSIQDLETLLASRMQYWFE